jgi:hypothetical protein
MLILSDSMFSTIKIIYKNIQYYKTFKYKSKYIIYYMKLYIKLIIALIIVFMVLKKYEAFEEEIQKAEYVKITDPRLKTHYITLVKYFTSTDVTDKSLQSKSLHVSKYSKKVKGFRTLSGDDKSSFLFQLKSINDKYYLKTYNGLDFLNLKYENVEKSYDKNMNDERYRKSEITIDIPDEALKIEEITPKPEVGYKYKINNNDYYIEIYKHKETDLTDLGLEFPADMKTISNKDQVDEENQIDEEDSVDKKQIDK